MVQTVRDHTLKIPNRRSVLYQGPLTGPCLAISGRSRGGPTRLWRANPRRGARLRAAELRLVLVRAGAAPIRALPGDSSHRR